MFTKDEMTKKKAIIRIRQMCIAIENNLDSGLKPDVICKRFNKARDSLKVEINSVRNGKTRLELLALLQATGEIPTIAKTDALALRGYAHKVDVNLPSLLEVCKNECFGKKG